MVYPIPVEGYFEENSFACIDEASGHGFIIDPGAEPERIFKIIRQHGWQIEKILLTHGHFDHTGGVDKLREILGCDAWANEKSVDYLSDPWLNLSGQCGMPMTVENVKFFKEGDVIKTADGGLSLKVIGTPGHTPDSVTFYNEKEGYAMVGDTIFKGAAALTHFPGGDVETLIETLRNKIFRLPPETVLYSGHTEETTLGAERPMYRI